MLCCIIMYSYLCLALLYVHLVLNQNVYQNELQEKLHDVTGVLVDNFFSTLTYKAYVHQMPWSKLN